MFNKFSSNSRGNDRGGDRGGARGGSRFGGRGDHGDRGGDRGGFGGGRPEMFRTTCATCGDSCEVPFKPANGKPIYCRSCFQNQDESYPKFAGKSFNSNSFEKFRGEEKRLFDTECSMCGEDCQVPFKPMAGRPVYCGVCMRKEDKMPMTGPKPMNAFNKSGAEAPSNSSGPSKAEFAALNTKIDRILSILELVMQEVEMDAEMDLEEISGEDFADLEKEYDEEFAEEEGDAEMEMPKKAIKKTSAAKAPAKADAKKPTRGQTKRAKRTGKTL